MEVHKNDLSDIIKSLPNIGDFKLTAFDFIICTLGFEDRTYNLMNILSGKKLLENTKIILIRYPTNEKENEVNYPLIKSISEKSRGLIEITYSAENIYKEIENYLKVETFENSNVAFDVSTCSSYVFYPIMHFLIHSNINLKIIYTEAETYHPTFEDWKKVEEKASKEDNLFIESFEQASFQSIGIRDIYSNTLFSEMNPGNHPSKLIMFPNFSPIRVNAIVEKDKDFNKTSFEDIIWFLSDPPLQSNKWRLDAVKKTNRLDIVDQTNLIAVSTLNYKEVLEKLEEQWIENRYKYHISIGSLGSKMQHLGIFFFNFLHEDIGLWLVEPIQFQAKLFSEGTSFTHEINFGDTKKLRNSLEKYMKYEYKLH